MTGNGVGVGASCAAIGDKVVLVTIGVELEIARSMTVGFTPTVLIVGVVVPVFTATGVVVPPVPFVFWFATGLLTVAPDDGDREFIAEYGLTVISPATPLETVNRENIEAVKKPRQTYLSDFDPPINVPLLII